MTEALVQWFVQNLTGLLSGEMVIFIISMVPVLELRGGLLAASPVFLDVQMSRAVPLCVLGNMLPIPLILLFINRLMTWMKRWRQLTPLVEWLEHRALSKAEQVEKYGFWGLVLFVGIPLPGTGAWTGSLIAALLNMKFSRAMWAVWCGVLMATVIMTAVSYGLLGMLNG